MTDNYQKLADNELIDRLAELTDRLADLRGIDSTYEIVIKEINTIQVEIEARNLIHKKKKWWLNLKK